MTGDRRFHDVMVRAADRRVDGTLDAQGGLAILNLSEGGKAAHEKGTAHEFSSKEAREAGRKGGEAVSADREHMAEIGTKGGEASGGNQGGSQRGGTSEQHRKAGEQSHKNT